VRPHRRHLTLKTQRPATGDPFRESVPSDPAFVGQPAAGGRRVCRCGGLPEDLAHYDDRPAKCTKPVRLTSNETGRRVQSSQGAALRKRHAEITAMERAIGVLRRQLAAKGLRENTRLFYGRDHGTSSESALGFPHRAAKGSLALPTPSVRHSLFCWHPIQA
jgi:hypothetical protein